MPQYARRTHETDPLVAARLQAITYADPYVFVHVDDVLDPETLTYEAFPQSDLGRDGGGWVPEPPPSRRPPPPPAVPSPVPRRPPPAPALSPRVRLVALGQRLELAGGSLLALLVLGLLAAAVAVVLLLRAQPHATSLARPGTAVAVRTSSGVSAPRSAATVVTVDVTGKVHHPGVYKLPAGARVVDAVRAAGGTMHGASLDTLNLAAKLVDGQQVVVGAPGTGPGAGAGAAGAGTVTGSEPSVVDLNTATVDQFQTLPGIGPVLAQHIVDYRTQHGPFPSVDALQQVSGIGPSKFAQLKDHVSA